MEMCFRKQLFSAIAATCLVGTAVWASDLPVYTDHLVNGFQDWSWASRNLSDNSVAPHAGSNSIAVSAKAWEAISFHQNDFDVSTFSNLVFWANGGSSGGQRLQIQAVYGNNVNGLTYSLPTALLANTWQAFSIPLSALGIANRSNVNRFHIQLKDTGTTNTFFVDEIKFAGKPPPSLVHITVSATQELRTVDSRWFGVNTAIWDSNFDTPATVALMKEAGLQILRFPGGSLSDEYHWLSNKSLTNTWTWSTSFSKFVNVATNLGAQAFITVNYGSGTAAEASAWVKHANVTNRYGFKYWEIGNECYGTWETDTNSAAHDAFTYATRARDYLQQMKAADPSIKVGVVAAPGEDSYANGYTGHPALNPRTGTSHNGWTAVMLSTLRSLSVTPDFIVHHRYPEFTSNPAPLNCTESDPLLLQTTSWANDVADLRQQISDYFGPTGTNIEIVCTENNSDAGAQGRQSTSLVNGVYYADSLGQLMQTELNAFVWWDWRNGTDVNGTFDSSLYGWRTYGDLGMINGLNTRHPTFFAAKLMQKFARAGDTVIKATTDYPLISAYGARRANGSTTLLVLNKDLVSSYASQITLAGFNPGSNVVSASYGIPQDEAARTNAPVQLQDINSTNLTIGGSVFSNTLAPLSLNLFTFSPAGPMLSVVPGNAGQIIIELSGEAGIPYVLQTSSAQGVWVNVSTNRLAGNSINLTNAILPASRLQLFRAVWLP